MIGVFDSGFSGLTVFNALASALPNRDLVYLGDSKNSPYGARPSIDVLTLSCVGFERLFSLGCRLVIIVCNTTSTVAMHWAQDEWMPSQRRDDGMKRNILGVVAPTIEVALGRASWAPKQAAPAGSIKTLGLFGTERMVMSEEYPKEIAKLAPDVRVVQQACPGLVPLIEMGIRDNTLRVLVERFVTDMYDQLDGNWPDRVVLACTHYPLIADVFAEFLPPHIPVIDQQSSVAAATTDYLKRHPEYDVKPTSSTGQRTYLATRFTADDAAFVKRISGDALPFKVV